MDQERNLRPLNCQEVKTMFFPAKNISVVIKMHQHDQYPSGGPSLMSGGTGNDWWVQSMQKNRRKESPTGPAENFPIVPFYWNILRSVQDPPRLFLQLWFEHLISGSNYLHCSKLKKKKNTTQGCRGAPGDFSSMTRHVWFTVFGGCCLRWKEKNIKDERTHWFFNFSSAQPSVSKWLKKGFCLPAWLSV